MCNLFKYGSSLCFLNLVSRITSLCFRIKSFTWIESYLEGVSDLAHIWVMTPMTVTMDAAKTVLEHSTVEDKPINPSSVVPHVASGTHSALPPIS